MANELIDVMREFGVEVRLLGTEEEPSPGGLAMADMLMEILRLRRLTPNLAYDAMGQPRPQGEIRTASTYVSPYVGTVESTPSTFRMTLREPAQPADAGGEDADDDYEGKWSVNAAGMLTVDYRSHLVANIPAQKIIDCYVELGLVPRREPVVVTDDDVEAAFLAWDESPAMGTLADATRATLQAFANRLNRSAR